MIYVVYATNIEDGYRNIVKLELKLNTNPTKPNPPHHNLFEGFYRPSRRLKVFM